MKHLEKLLIDESLQIPEVLPLVPIRDLVIFPHAVVPLLIGRDKSLAAVQEAGFCDDFLMVATQKDSEKEAVSAADIYRTGTVVQILQIIEFPQANFKVVVEGIARARIQRFLKTRRFFQTRIQLIDPVAEESNVPDVYIKQLFYYFQEYINYNQELPDAIVEHLHQQHDPNRMIDFVALNLQLDTPVKQKILQETRLEKRFALVLDALRKQIGFQRMRADIDQKVQESLMKNQRNYYMQEKLRILNRELGEEDEIVSPEIRKLEEEIEAAKMPQHAREKAGEELSKLKKIPPFSPEYTVIRNYLDWMVRLPWSVYTEDRIDIVRAQEILDEDHYGLEKPKERIIEHLAVLQRVQHMKGPILCLVGPPGVGKTSLGKSVARALGRNFVRVSLGGVRDEAEIRGHRRTYIGALPGKIIQSMKKAGSNNPVFLLDEVDKMNADFRGDPASALLEVLDPEQNKHFNDHYLDVDYDLSRVFFITTANVRSAIPPPLLDRMEVIELPGYLEPEKVQIARRHLIPKQFAEHGISETEMKISEGAILRMIREYTREAGVRNLEREIANLCRKAVRRLSENGKVATLQITEKNLESYLGKPEFLNRAAELTDEIGVATGLAWTPYGGDLLKIEVSVFPGKHQLRLTGQLGDVMKESAQAALTFIRSLSDELSIAAETFEKNEIHIHVPEGAIPKDGPSAGIALASAMVSALTNRPVRNSIAMTGEITLRGKVLAVGGLNEKLLAAQRNHIHTVIVPAENKKEIDDLPAELREGMTIIQVKDYQEVLERVLVGE